MRKWLRFKLLLALVSLGLWASLLPSLYGDGNDANTITLLAMDGADASTTFTDDAEGSALTWTAVGNAQIDTVQSVFGGASGLFDGVGDKLTAPDSAVWDFGTGNYCVDLRIRQTNTSNFLVDISAGDAGGGQGPTIRILGADRWIIYTQNNVKIDFTGSAPGTAVWRHVALNRKGTGASQLQLFMDGVQIATGTDAANITGGTAGVSIADNNANGDAFDGWMDEVRISNVSRFGANFTPQDHAYHIAGGGGGAAAVVRVLPGFGRKQPTRHWW